MMRRDRPAGPAVRPPLGEAELDLLRLEFPGRGPMTITRGQKELLADALARLDQLGKEPSDG